MVTAATKVAPLMAIGFRYTPGAGKVANHGHTIQIDLSAGVAVRLAIGDYRLLQLHFHTPSEEKIDGKSYPLVAHLVHKSAQGNLAVVAVLLMWRYVIHTTSDCLIFMNRGAGQW